MMENLVKESLEVLRGYLQPSQVDAVMHTDVTSEEVRSPVVKDTTIQAIDEYMDWEHRKCNKYYSYSQHA